MARTSEIGFWTVAAARPDHVALVDVADRSRTYGDLAAATNRVARGLRKIGIERGDCVALIMTNRVEFVETYLAAMQIGVYLTPVNWHLTAPEMSYILRDSQARVVVADSRVARTVTNAVEATDLGPSHRFSVGDLDGFQPYSALIEGQSDALPENRAIGSPMLYTSGTTGRPKGVRRAISSGLPERAGAMAGLFNMLFGVQPGEGSHLLTGPLYHAAPSRFAIGALHLGQTLVLTDRWAPEAMLDSIERHHVTDTHVVPTMLYRLLALPEETRRSRDLSSLRAVIHGAAPCSVALKQRALEWLGPIVYEYYAATEGGGTYVRPEEWYARPGTVGRPIPGTALRVLDQHGSLCDPGTPGKVFFRSTPFDYHGDAGATAPMSHDGFVTVGDIGYLDSDGWLFLCDREADVIVSGGVNIYPAEIESVLLEHPSVFDVAVVGVPNEEWGECVKAVVQLTPEGRSDVTVASLRVWAEERLASFKCPREIEFNDRLPRDESGKMSRKQVRDAQRC